MHKFYLLAATIVLVTLITTIGSCVKDPEYIKGKAASYQKKILDNKNYREYALKKSRINNGCK